MIDEFISNKEVDDLLDKYNLNRYKKIFYNNNINTLYRISLLTECEIHKFLSEIDKNNILFELKILINELKLKPESKSLQERVYYFKDTNISMLTILSNKNFITNGLSKKVVQLFFLYLSFLKIINIIRQSILYNIFTYTKSYKISTYENFKCLNSTIIINNYHKFLFYYLEDFLYLFGYLFIYIVSYYNKNIYSIIVFKIIYMLIVFNIIITNISKILLCDIYKIYEINEYCNIFCKPWIYNNKIPLMEIIYLANIYFLFKYQNIFIRLLIIQQIIYLDLNFMQDMKYNISVYILYYPAIMCVIYKLTIIIPEIFHIYGLYKAYKLIRNDWNKYNYYYKKICLYENNYLNILNNHLKYYKNNKTNYQYFDNLDQIYDDSFKLNLIFQKIIKKISLETCGVVIGTNVKNPQRSIEKICRNYKRDVRRINDIIRTTVVFCKILNCKGTCNLCEKIFGEYINDDNILNSTPNILFKKILNKTNEMQNNSFKDKKEDKINIELHNNDDDYTNNTFNNTFNNILNFIKELQNSNELEIVKIKNRFTKDYNSYNSIGYRDILINVKIEYKMINDNIIIINRENWSCENKYMICEIQLHLLCYFSYKITRGHTNYKKYRNLLSI